MPPAFKGYHRLIWMNDGAHAQISMRPRFLLMEAPGLLKSSWLSDQLVVTRICLPVSPYHVPPGFKSCSTALNSLE